MKNLIVLIICLLGIAFYAYKHIDWNPPKKEAIYAVEVNGKTVPVSEVRVEQIPQEVYDSMKDNGRWANHLTGDKKRLLLITWDGCPYARAFHSELDKAFGKSGYFDKYYVKDVEVTGKSVGGYCEGPLAEHCPLIWLMHNCINGICIINPKTKEAIIDESQNAKQILPLLMAYATWDTEPLLGKNK